MSVGPPAYRKRLRARLAEAQNWRCCYCGIRMDGNENEPNAPTLEHVNPIYYGGSGSVENLVVACRDCNGRVDNTPFHVKRSSHFSVKP